MFKKIILPICLALFSVVTFAQDVKLGYINSQEVMMMMPEISDVEKQIANMNEENRKYLETMESEIQAEAQKYKAEEATMTEAIRKIKEEELQSRYTRLQTAYQTMQQTMQQEQQKLLAPLQDKLQKAIDDVSSKNNLTFVFDLSTGSIVYKNPKAFDITPLVKKQLGILQ